MKNNFDKILLGHGSGGQMSQQLISDLFIRYFNNPVLREQTDAAVLQVPSNLLSFTTDSFVVDPIFFPGGNIGKLAICGTVNDLAVTGARPMFISAAFILEEGLPFEHLEDIVRAMAEEAAKAGVMIVTGDTKVVNKGKCDKVFINTAGIGVLEEKYRRIAIGSDIQPGDKILVNGSIGDHGISVMAARNELNIHSGIGSDCACLNGLIRDILDVSDGVRFMRDPTRGGLATVVAELAEGKPYSVKLEESSIYVDQRVRSFCELLGFDPLYVANEGKVVLIVKKEDAQRVLDAMKGHELGRHAAIIGEIHAAYPGKAWMETGIGGRRILDMLAGEQLPRIC
jgi:hydrogenase expression/formation protein HypE